MTCTVTVDWAWSAAGRRPCVGSWRTRACMSSAMTTATPESRPATPFAPPYTAVELAEDAVGILDPYVSNFQRNAMPQSPRPNSCWLDEPITGEQAMICLHFLGTHLGATARWVNRFVPVIAAEADLGTCTPHPFAHLMIGQRQALRAAYAALLKERVAVHLCPGMVGQLPCWSGHIAATAAMSYRVMPMCGRCVTSGCAPREANPSTQLLATLLIHSSGLWCASTGTDGTRRTGTTASTGTAARKDACGGSRLRSYRSKADPASARVEKLRAWFAPTDGEDALWLWLPRCSW
jgi:fluoride ion exporter CrcB/FEX